MNFKLSKAIARVEDMKRNDQLIILAVVGYAIIVSVVAGYLATHQTVTTTTLRSQYFGNPTEDAKAIDNPFTKSAMELLDESSDTRKEIAYNGSAINLNKGESYRFDGMVYDQNKTNPAVLFTVYSVEKHSDFGISHGLKLVQGDFTVSVNSKNVLEVIRN